MEMIHSFSDIEFVKWTQEQVRKSHNEDMAVLESATSDPFSVPPSLILRSIAWLRDKEVLVRRKTKEKLLKLYHSYCEELFQWPTGSHFVEHLEWIPPSLIAYAIDEDCDEDKMMNVESFILDELFPDDATDEDVVYHWMKFFLYMTMSQKSFLESIILEKKRFLKEIKDYMKLSEEKKNFSEGVHPSIYESFSKMSKFFRNHDEAFQGFLALHEMRNPKLFKELLSVLRFETEFYNSRDSQRLILKEFGSDHPSYCFLRKLLVKCSSSIFRYNHLFGAFLILRKTFGEKSEKCGDVHVSTYDIPCTIDLLSMVVDLYPESVMGSKNLLVKLFSRNAEKQPEMLIQMLARIGHRLPLKFCDFDLTSIVIKGTPSESIYAVSALQSMGAPIPSEVREMKAFKPFSEDMDAWSRAVSDPFSVSLHFVLQAAEWIRDKSVFVRRKTKEKLLDVYRSYCLKFFQTHCLDQSVDHLERIPSTLISYAMDEDFGNFGTLNVELLISEELFPDCLTFDHVMYHWMKFFLYMSVSQRRFLESLILQKKRFRKEMKNYLKNREKGKEDFSDIMLEKIYDSFLKMSGFFGDFSAAVNGFHLLHQINDNDLFSELSQLLHKHTCFDKSQLYKRSILARIGDKHPVYGFLKILLAKCSYSLFSFDHVKYIFLVMTNGSFGKVTRNKIWDVSLFDTNSVFQLFLMILSGYSKFLKCYKDAQVESGVSTEVPQMVASASHLFVENTCPEVTSLAPIFADAFIRWIHPLIPFDYVEMLHGGIQNCDDWKAEDVDSCDQDTTIGPIAKSSVHVVGSNSLSLAARWKRKSDEQPADVSSKRINMQ